MVKVDDMGNYYRIPADTRDLNYNKFFTDGESKIFQTEEYTSHNTYQMNLQETKELLLKLRFIREDVFNEKLDPFYAPWQKEIYLRLV